MTSGRSSSAKCPSPVDLRQKFRDLRRAKRHLKHHIESARRSKLLSSPTKKCRGKPNCSEDQMKTYLRKIQ